MSFEGTDSDNFLVVAVGQTSNLIIWRLISELEVSQWFFETPILVIYIFVRCKYCYLVILRSNDKVICVVANCKGFLGEGNSNRILTCLIKDEHICVNSKRKKVQTECYSAYRTLMLSDYLKIVAF